MSLTLRHLDRFFIGGDWVTPSSDATITVTDPATEERFLSVAEARAPDMARAVGAAHEAFATGPWPRMSHAEQLPLRGGGTADERWQLRAARARARRGRRGDHPVERSPQPDDAQAGAGAAGGLHRGAQALTRSAG